MVLVPSFDISSFLNSTSYLTVSMTSFSASNVSPRCAPKTATKNNMSPV